MEANVITSGGGVMGWISGNKVIVALIVIIAILLCIIAHLGWTLWNYHPQEEGEYHHQEEEYHHQEGEDHHQEGEEEESSVVSEISTIEPQQTSCKTAIETQLSDERKQTPEPCLIPQSTTYTPSNKTKTSEEPLPEPEILQNTLHESTQSSSPPLLEPSVFSEKTPDNEPPSICTDELPPDDDDLPPLEPKLPIKSKKGLKFGK